MKQSIISHNQMFVKGAQCTIVVSAFSLFWFHEQGLALVVASKKV